MSYNDVENFDLNTEQSTLDPPEGTEALSAVAIDEWQKATNTAGDNKVDLATWRTGNSMLPDLEITDNGKAHPPTPSKPTESGPEEKPGSQQILARREPGLDRNSRPERDPARDVNTQHERPPARDPNPRPEQSPSDERQPTPHGDFNPEHKERQPERDAREPSARRPEQDRSDEQFDNASREITEREYRSLAHQIARTGRIPESAQSALDEGFGRQGINVSKLNELLRECRLQCQLNPTNSGLRLDLVNSEGRTIDSIVSRTPAAQAAGAEIRRHQERRR